MIRKWWYITVYIGIHSTTVVGHLSRYRCINTGRIMHDGTSSIYVRIPYAFELLIRIGISNTDPEPDVKISLQFIKRYEINIFPHFYIVFHEKRNNFLNS
jgi:hypothetical protein